MPCEHYKEALIESAATGAEPQGELRAHLGACAACRAAFAEEQSFFSSIDVGLHALANAEVPASLLPRVRARLDEAAVSQRRWMQPLIFAAASVVLAAIVFLAAKPRHAGPQDQAQRIPTVPARVLPTARAPHENSNANAPVVSSNANHSTAPQNSTFFRPVASSQSEVLVPPDEREAFAQFVAAVQKRSDVATALLTPAPKKDALASVDPLQIANLELKPLEGRETEVSDREGEKH